MARTGRFHPKAQKGIGISQVEVYERAGKSVIRELRTRVFETRTATGSELFSLLTCPQTTTFTLLSIFSLLETSSIKIWETIRSYQAKCFLPVAVRASKTDYVKKMHLMAVSFNFKALHENDKISLVDDLFIISIYHTSE